MITTFTVFPREKSERLRRYLLFGTFYWIALTDATDTFHRRALQINDEIVTTDEVLSEYLTFFCAAPEFLRREVALVVEDILADPTVKVIAQSHESFLAGLRLYRERPALVPLPQRPIRRQLRLRHTRKLRKLGQSAMRPL